MNKIDIRRFSSFKYAMVIGLMLIMGACASSHIPAPNTSNARSMINQAEEAGAQDYAPLELRKARQKIKKTKALVKDEKYQEANQLNEEAAVDAKLAMVKARSAKAQEAVKQLQETIDTLKKEIQRNQNNQ